MKDSINQKIASTIFLIGVFICGLTHCVYANEFDSNDYNDEHCAITEVEILDALKSGDSLYFKNIHTSCLHLSDPNILYLVAYGQQKFKILDYGLKYFDAAEHAGYQSMGAIEMQRAKIFIFKGQTQKAVTHIQAAAAHGHPVYKYLLIDEVNELYQNNVQAYQVINDSRPSFNFWTSLLSAIAVIGFSLSLILITLRKQFAKGILFLSLLLSAFSMIISCYIIYWTKYAIDFPYFLNIWHSLTYLIGPSYYLYLLSRYEKVDFNKYTWLHFVPASIFFILSLPTLLSVFGITLQWPRLLTHLALHYLPKLIHLGIYLVASFAFLRNMWQTDDQVQNWTRWIIGSYGFYFLMNTLYYILVRWEGFNAQWDYGISFAMSLFILSIGYLGFVQPQVFRGKLTVLPTPATKYRTSGLTKAASESINRALKELMKEQKVYKENELRLGDLANYLEVNKNHLSQVINENYNMGFFEFINIHRIAHVVDMFDNPAYDSYTLIECAYDAGYNNKVTFIKAFKLIHEVTPSQFRKKILAKRKDAKTKLHHLRKNN